MHKLKANLMNINNPNTNLRIRKKNETAHSLDDSWTNR
jgi:hypothetical protein